MGTTNNILNQLAGQIEADVAQIAIPALTNIQNAFAAVVAAKGDPATVISQQAVIVANVNTLILEAPALIPVLQQQAIVAGASLAQTEIGNVITYLNGLITPPPATGKKAA